MNKTRFIFPLLLLCLACSNQKAIEDLQSENNALKTRLEALKEKHKALLAENDSLKTGDSQPKSYYATELLHSRLLKILDTKHSEDTLDLPIDGTGFVYKRDVTLSRLDNALFAEAFGSMREKLEKHGYAVFTICDGAALPLEMCNCTDSIYVVVEPENIGEAYELYRAGFYYNVDLIALEALKDDNGGQSILLTFEHGAYPRKKERINLSAMTLQHEL